MSRHPQHLTNRGPPPSEVLGGARGSGFGRDLEQQMCIWENERWNVLDRRFKPSRHGKLDPPHHTSQDGAATSVQQVEHMVETMSRVVQHHSPSEATAAHADSDGGAGPVQPAGFVHFGIRKIIRWAPGSGWTPGPWLYAVAFQGQFKPKMEKSSFVRKRRWARACETCSKKPLRQPGAPKPSIVFSEETVFKRQLENKKWRTCAATRNGPRWVQQYRVDCRSCGIDSRRSLAAFLASDAYGAFNRQAAARKLLAGLYQWPEGSPATTIAESKSGGNLEVLCDEIFGQLIEDIARLGVEEGCDQAMKTLAMIALNAQARANDPNTTTATVDPAPGHAAPAAEAPTPAARAAQGEGADLNKFIDQSILDMSKMKSEVEALDMGWDAADGWFVVDDGDELLVRAKADRADAKMTTKQHHQNDVQIVAHVMLPRAKADRPGDSSDTVPAAPAQDGGGAMSRAALDDLDLYNGAGPPVAVAEDHRSSVARSVYVDAVSEQVPPPMSAVVTGPGDGSAASSAPPPTDAMDTSLLELSSVYFDANDGDVGGDGDGGGPATTAARADTPPGPGADRKEKVMAEIALLRKIMADNNMPNPPAGH